MKLLYCATLVAALALTGFIPVNFVKATEGLWYFPIENYREQLTEKKFGQNIDANFYRGRENLFPTKFLGLHAGDDLEIFPGEENKNVPVYATTTGTVSFSGNVSGHGGVILIDITGENLTALYGHLELRSALVKVGDRVSPGQLIAYLGRGFSSETSGERKHLHFAFHKGKNQYFRGHEPDQIALQQNWTDPQEALKNQKAIYIDEEMCALTE
jgi:murein DD-endopeptidase MepM/ murein hydrolase activator NlpD